MGTANPIRLTETIDLFPHTLLIFKGGTQTTDLKGNVKQPKGRSHCLFPNSA